MNMRKNSYRMMTCYKTPAPGSPLIHPPPPRQRMSRSLSTHGKIGLPSRSFT